MSESSGLALADRSTRRRWLISAAIVVLFHAGLAAGVLTWRNMRAAPPVEIDLTPLPSASGQNEAEAARPAEQTSPAPSKTDTAAAAAGDQAAPPDSVPPQSMPSEITSPAEQTAHQDAAGAGPGTRPTETMPGMTAPQLPPSPQGAEAGGTGSAPPAINPRIGSAPVTAPGGLAAGSPRPASPMANMPLDTSITVQPPVRGNGAIGPLASRETGPLDRMPMSEFRPARPSGVPDIPRNGAQGAQGVQGAQGAHGGNGARVQDRARAAMARSIGRTETPKNAIGSSATVLASRGDATGPNAGGTRNAIGITANFRPRIPRGEVGGNKIGVTAIAGRAMPTAPVINGHGFARPAIGPAMIGGPARASGGLSGTDFHLRHP